MCRNRADHNIGTGVSSNRFAGQAVPTETAMIVIRFLAVVLTGLTPIAPGAHVFELLNKIALSRIRA